ncbi:MAG: ribonuclease R [Verrucomicrobia bacterium]|nr:ribonuclease R [Verrucomicrobiota bacterium]
MEEQILNLLGRHDYVPANVPELLRQLAWLPHRQQELQLALQRLEQSGRVMRTKGNRYIQSAEADLIPGRIKINKQGKGFLQPDDAGLREIVIPEEATGTALNEDRVLVRRDVKPRGLRPERPEAETGAVIRILERHRTRIVGTLQRGRQFLYVTPDDPRIPHDILVPEPRDVGRPAQVGDKVVVELQEWESRHSNPEGEVIEVLGAPDAEGVDMLSVLRQYDLPLHFPKNILDEARAIGSEVRSDELAGREDCRQHQVVTIDPDDAKDFDDAICLQRASRDEWKLWVHIADVSHYVKPGTALDDEARKRGNSTYLVDRVIPMLPEALSNELCSLKPRVDRLTKCVEFLLSFLLADDGRVLATKFYPAVIHSQRRFTYKEVLAVLQGQPKDAIERMLHDANTLTQKIRRRRFQAGSLELDFPEQKIRLDERGRILRIEKVENDVSHQLIEECMLLANEAVATRLMSLRTPAVYRVHEKPDARRLQEYREDVLSHPVPCGNLEKPGEPQKLLAKLGTLPIGAALKIGFLRSLMRARYDVEPLGHYGLAKDKYTHFTSPIRRYADLVVHRALFRASHGATYSLKQTAEHISGTERNSADAERDSKDVKLYAYLKAQLQSAAPPRYDALVIDVRNFGFFVDVPGLTMSGLVHLSSIEDDFYIFDPVRNTLTGRRRRRVFRLGDKVQVQIAKVDSIKKMVDFRLAAGSGAPSQPQTIRREIPARRAPALPQSREGRPVPNQREGGPHRERRPEAPRRDQRGRTQGGRPEGRPEQRGSLPTNARPTLRVSSAFSARGSSGGATLPTSQSRQPDRKPQRPQPAPPRRQFPKRGGKKFRR